MLNGLSFLAVIASLLLMDVPPEPPPVNKPKAPLEEMTFSTHVLSLHATGLMALGLLGEAEKDPETVRHIIETLAMLQAKTTGNLTREEDRLLTSVVHELRLKFVERP